MKLSNITVGTAHKPNVRVTSSEKRANTAGVIATNGGTPMSIAGAKSMIGMTSMDIRGRMRIAS
jgi:hypothetical protein